MLLYGICAGIVGGIGNSVKSFLPILVIACIIVSLLKQLYAGKVRSLKQTAIFVLVFLLFIAAENMTVSLITGITEDVFHVELDFSDATPHYLNVGLNRQGEGQIHKGDLSRLYIQDRTNGVSLEDAKVAAKERLKADWSGHESEVIKFIIKKTIWAWQDDYTPVRYFSEYLCLTPSTPVENQVFAFVTKYFPSITEIWYLGTMFLGLVGALIVIRKKLTDAQWLLVFNNLLVVGYFCLILLSEAQSRYKCLILPYVCIFAAYSSNEILIFIKDFCIHRKKSPLPMPRDE